MRPDQVIAEARSWIGTPYAHQHSTKGAGCDCLGLLRGIYRFINGREPEYVKHYSKSWSEGTGIESMLAGARSQMIEVDPVDISIADVVVFRMKPHMVAKHCAIISEQEPAMMIHSVNGSGVITSQFEPWSKKIAGVFRFEGVS